jgi:hypothetical protein
MDFFHHKDIANYLLQLCPKVVKHPVYKCVPEDVSSRVKPPELESDHSTSFAEVKNTWNYTATPHVFIAKCIIN